MLAPPHKREIPFAKITRFEHRRRSDLQAEQPENMDSESPQRPTAEPPGAPASAEPPAAATSRQPDSPTLYRTVREDGLCILTLDRPESSANIFDERALTELREQLDWVASAANLKGLVLISAKPSIFVAGADLKSMSEKGPDDIKKLVELGQEVINRLADLRIPTVAAIHGAAVGGGYELCLACDYRVATDDKSTKIGLPETLIGLLPAWGGATRLPRHRHRRRAVPPARRQTRPTRRWPVHHGPSCRGWHQRPRAHRATRRSGLLAAKGAGRATRARRRANG